MKKISALFNFLVDFVIGRDLEIIELQKLNYDEIFNKLKKRFGCYFDFVFPIFSYKDPLVKKMIWQMKFRENGWAAEIFGIFLSQFFIEKFLKEAPIKPLNEEILIIPIPIHKKRRAERGYNQCEWLGKEMMKHLPKNPGQNITYSPKILRRVKYTEKQSWNNEENRRKNISGVFRVSKNFDFENSVVVLIDDVCTTGATLTESRNVLLEAGVKKVYALVVAH